MIIEARKLYNNISKNLLEPKFNVKKADLITLEKEIFFLLYRNLCYFNHIMQRTLFFTRDSYNRNEETLLEKTIMLQETIRMFEMKNILHDNILRYSRIFKTEQKNINLLSRDFGILKMKISRLTNTRPFDSIEKAKILKALNLIKKS